MGSAKGLGIAVEVERVMRRRKGRVGFIVGSWIGVDERDLGCNWVGLDNWER
jgi:hypothetical protein